MGDKNALLKQLTAAETDMLKMLLQYLPDDIFCIIHTLDAPPEMLTIPLNCTDAISVIIPKKTA